MQQAQYQCQFRHAISITDPFVSVTAIIDVRYRIFGIENVSVSGVFNWDNQTKQWIEGTLVN
jgi:hypothetical protein